MTVTSVRRNPFIGCDCRAAKEGYLQFQFTATMICIGMVQIKYQETQFAKAGNVNRDMKAREMAMTISVATMPQRSMTTPATMSKFAVLAIAMWNAAIASTAISNPIAKAG